MRPYGSARSGRDLILTGVVRTSRGRARVVERAAVAEGLAEYDAVREERDSRTRWLRSDLVETERQIARLQAHAARLRKLIPRAERGELGEDYCAACEGPCQEA